MRTIEPIEWKGDSASLASSFGGRFTRCQEVATGLSPYFSKKRGIELAQLLAWPRNGESSPATGQFILRGWSDRRPSGGGKCIGVDDAGIGAQIDLRDKRMSLADRAASTSIDSALEG